MFQRIRRALAEAVEIDDFQSRLRLVTHNDEHRAEVLEAALVVAQSGISLDDLQHAITAQVHGPFFPRVRADAMDVSEPMDALTSNELAEIIIDTFDGIYVPFSVRYGLAYAIMRAGYTKTPDAEYRALAADGD